MNKIVDIVAFAMPWSGSLVPAIMTYRNAQKNLGFQPFEAIVIGVVVEGIGFVSITTALDYYEQNIADGKSQDGQFWVAVGGAAMYVIVILLVNAILDGGSILQKIAMGLLSMMAVVGGLMVALRNQLGKRRELKAQMEADEKAAKEKLEADEIEKREKEQMLNFQREQDEINFQRKLMEQKLEDQRRERDAKREERLTEKRIEAELRLAESRKAEVPVTENVAESSTNSQASDGKSLRWSVLSDSDKQRVIAIMRQSRAENGKNWKKSAAVTVIAEFRLDERQAYKWLEYAERDAEKFEEVSNE
jgi:hypothetical protein